MDALNQIISSLLKAIAFFICMFLNFIHVKVIIIF